MAQVVQAKCPHCQNVLRIPADWLTKAMRCKHCQKTFQAKGKSTAVNATNVAAGTPAAKPAATPAIAVGAPPKAPSNAPLNFDANDPTPSIAKSPAKRRKSGMGGLLILVGMFAFLFLIGLAGAGFVVYKVVSNWDEEPVKLVKGTEKNGGAKPGDGGSTKTDGNPKGDGQTIVPPSDDGGKKKKSPSTDGKKDKKNTTPKFTNDPFPRRALLISVNNYLMYSTVQYGSGRDPGRGAGVYPGSSTGVLREMLTRPPMNIPPLQITELSDGIEPGSRVAQPHSTQKSVIETTIKDFVESSRAQDRIMILFAGHATSVETGEDDKKQTKSYLVPIDGTRDPDKLIPLKWVYDQLASCKAQQKVLILDVFRYSPGRGHELPSPGEGAEGTMPEAFDKDLQNPPPGVQVWCSCLKEQVSLELDRGSAFLQAMCNALQAEPEMKGFSNQAQPIPIEGLVPAVNQRLAELAKAEKKEQGSRLTGKMGEAVAWNKDEAAPPVLALKPPTAPGGEAAGAAMVNNLLDEIKMLPAYRATRAGDVNLLRAQNLPVFPAKKLESYKTDDYQNIAELHKRYLANKEEFGKKYPLRAGYFEVIEALQVSDKKVSLREVLSSPVNPKDKAKFKDEQGPLGESIFYLDRALGKLKDLEKDREMETSKRWQANFDYARARLQSRLIYLFEYNYTLGQIRADNLPELQPGQSGWRVGITGAKINVTERAAKDLAKANKILWGKMQEQYPGTPWALLAEREDAIALGLAWRPKSD